MGNEDNNSKNTYAKFYQRLIAYFIDGIIYSIILIPYALYSINNKVSFTKDFLFSYSSLIFFLILGLTILFGAFYPIYLIGKYGQTIGKMVMKIKIVRIDGKKINYKTAYERSSPLIYLNIISLFADLYIYIDGYQRVEKIMHSLEAQFLIDTGIYDFLFPILFLLSDPDNFVFNLLLIFASNCFWIYLILALITLLFDKENRTIHDYIANTKVIKKKINSFGI